MASKGLGPLPRMKWAALAHGCGRGGRVVLPLARAAAVSTGLRVPLAHDAVTGRHDAQAACRGHAQRRHRLVRVRVRLRAKG